MDTPSKHASPRSTTFSRIEPLRDRSRQPRATWHQSYLRLAPEGPVRLAESSGASGCVQRRRGRLVPLPSTLSSQSICRSGAESWFIRRPDACQDLPASPSARTEQAGERAKVPENSREPCPSASSTGPEPPCAPTRAHALILDEEVGSHAFFRAAR